jgi:hypothetical protein
VQDELAAGRLAVASFADWPEAARVVHLLVRASGRPPEPVVAFTVLLEEAHARR